ncbi:unnamed protein product [Caenorhabditis sp. 36 PRJEB53466]|nr:unnamed protein product [Caenorhabditis sp. 36 PRJEB53466]
MMILHITTFSALFLVSLIRRADGQQCQCVSPEVAASCLDYDSTLQAETLDQAIASFTDLSMNGIDAQQPVDVGCLTEQCQDCRKDLRKQLRKVGLLAPDINDILSATTDRNSTCTRYRFVLENSQKETKEDEDGSSSEEEEKEKREKKDKSKKPKREKRAANLQDPTVIGTRFTISCSQKGVSVDPTGTVSLCNSCWVWRQLPSNYRPQFINELVCDTSDDSCLSGYAQCTVGHRTFEALRNDSGVTTTVTLTAGSYCECRISEFSSLQSLVAGTGISGTYTPVGHNNNNTVSG